MIQTKEVKQLFTEGVKKTDVRTIIKAPKHLKPFSFFPWNKSLFTAIYCHLSCTTFNIRSLLYKHLHNSYIIAPSRG